MKKSSSIYKKEIHLVQVILKGVDNNGYLNVICDANADMLSKSVISKIHGLIRDMLVKMPPRLISYFIREGNPFLDIILECPNRGKYSIYANSASVILDDFKSQISEVAISLEDCIQRI